MKMSKVIALAAVLIACPAIYAQFAPTGTTTVSVTISSEAALQVTTGTTTLAAT
jgi:hypothetical protein